MKRKGILGGIIVVVLILVLTLAVGGGSVSAEEPTIIASGSCGKAGSNVTWTLDSTGLLTISGEGEMEDYTYSYDDASSKYITNAPWRKRQVKSATVQDGVASIGGYAFYGCTGLTGVTIPDSVTNIGNYAFENCTGLTGVTIGNSVTSIGYYAFNGCTGLTEILYNAKAAADLALGSDVFRNAGSSSGGLRVIIGDGVRKIPSCLFSGCTGLTGMTIGNSVTSIGNDAFENCTGLTSVTIPNSVTNIGRSAFSDCTGLTEIYYNAKSVEGSSSAFDGAGTSSGGIRAVIGDSVELIPAYLFSDCTGLSSVTIPDSVTSIGGSAFSGCTGLTGVTIPDSVTNIGNYAFENCTGLTGVTIGNSVTSIGYYAFNGCTGLTEILYNAKAAADLALGSDVFRNAGSSSGGLRVVIGDGVEHIPAYLFYGCKGLTSVTIGNSVTSIGGYTFYGCTGLTSVTIPNGVTSIEVCAFYGCTGLTSVTIPDSVTSIGGSAFYGCAGLTSVTIPDSVTSIGAYAFSGCTGLTGMTIGNSVTSIGNDAFENCTGLTSVTIPNSVTNIGRSAFSGCTGLTEIYYNAKSIEEGNSFSYFEGAGTSSDGLRAVIGDSVERIPANLFGGCTGLTSVTIPDSVTSIGGSAFSGCTGLTEVYYNAKSVKGESFAFEGAGTSSGGLRVVIGDGVEKIPGYLFSNCTGLTSVTIPDSVTNIGSSAFSGCTGLTSVTIPDSVTSIGGGAFGDCTSLREIYYNAKAVEDLARSYCVFGGAGTSTNGIKVFVGEKVKKIPAYLFYGAYGENGNNILECEFLGAPPTVGAGAFGEITRIYAYYPMHNSAWTESVRKAYGSKFYWRGYCYEPLSSGVCKINKTVYMTGDTLDVNGISMTVTHEDGCVETISYNSGLLKLGSYDMSTVGVKLIDVTYKDITAQLKICVYERKTEVMDKAGYPESSHDYENNLDKTYTYEAKGAITLDVTFSPQTEVETNVDYLYVNGTKYTGTALAGKTITVNGDTLTIRLVSDKSDSAYGFSIDRIVKTYINAETVVPPTCTERGYTMYLASGTVGNYVDALGHSFGDDQICSVCAAKLESIYISALPAKTVYSVGDGSLNLTGGKLMLVCDSGETEVNLTAAMVSGFDNTILGKQTLTVTVGGLTTTFEVEVVERTVTSVAVENGKLVKHYTDGTTEETPLKDGAISDFAISETGEKTLTLTSENACVAAYKDADGNYVALKAVANEDGSYSYVVPEEVTEVTVAVKGDLDGDGRINMKDLAQLRRNMAEGTVEGGLEQLLIDFNGDGVVNMKDMGILRRYLAGGYDIELGW